MARHNTTKVQALTSQTNLTLTVTLTLTDTVTLTLTLTQTLNLLNPNFYAHSVNTHFKVIPDL